MELKLQNNKPKGSFNISNKEKSLLLLLVTVIIAWLSYTFVITPQEAAISALKADKAIAEIEQINLQDPLRKESVISNEYNRLKLDYEKVADKYYSKFDQPEIMHMINSIVDNSKLEIPSISFEEPVYIEIEGIDAELNGVALAYKGSFSDLENLLSQLRNSPKRLIIEQLSMAREVDGSLNGQISINSIANNSGDMKKDGHFYTNDYEALNKVNPFEAFKGYKATEVNSDSETVEKRAILSDMESDNIYYMASGSGVTGKVDRIAGGKFGKTAIRTEFYISAGYQPERAQVVLDDQNIDIKYPPPSMGVWAYSYGYSPTTVGMRFQDPDGEKIDIKLSEGVNWVGWKYISASPPQDVNIYPLKLDRLYMELGSYKDDYGVLLFDRIEADYPNSGEEGVIQDSFEFYVVQPGDTFEAISEKFYGTSSHQTKLAKDNGLDSKDMPEAGRVLVIRK